VIRKVSARDDIKRAIQLWWKQESSSILSAIRAPTSNSTQGIADIDWQIHLTTASRHVPNVRAQSATVVLQAAKGNARDKIMFEVNKQDVSMILDKLSILDQLIPTK